MSQRIIAIGGGGFLMEPDNPLLDLYFLQKTEKSNPKVCFIPTASGDSEDFLSCFYSTFAKYQCEPSHLAFFRKSRARSIPLNEIEQHLLQQDAIYVGGGNTRSMLAVWKEWNLNAILKKAWNAGVLLGGMSAGALCWFEYGGSDSIGIAGIDRIFPLQGLGFLNGSCTPHYDNELNRRPDLHQLIIDRKIPAGVGIDDGAAVLFEEQQVIEVVSSRITSKAYRVSLDNGRIVEQELLTRYLG